jgi:hypothetical protein
VRIAQAVEILEAARASGESPEAVTAKVEKVSPDLAELLRLIVPRTPEAFWTFVAALVTVLSLILSQSQDQLSPEEIARRIVHEVTRLNEPVIPDESTTSTDESPR